MTKRTLSNKSRYSILKLSGFRARMTTAQGRNTIKNRRRKGRKKLAIQTSTFLQLIKNIPLVTFALLLGDRFQS